MDEINIGFIGYSNTSFDIEKAKSIIYDIFDVIENKYCNEENLETKINIISGATDIGIPSLVSNVADNENLKYGKWFTLVGIMAKEDSYLTIMIEQRFKEVGVKPSSIYYFAQPNLIASILSSNKNSAAILSESLCESIQDIVRIPIIDPVNIKHLLLWKKGVQLTPGMKLFIKQMKKMYPQAAPY